VTRHDTLTLVDGLWLRGRHTAAFRLLLAAARRRDATIYLNLGYAYDMGLGVRRSKRKALRWYRAALEASPGSAAHNIGTVYRDQGKLIAAARWIQKSIAYGNSGSHLDYGQLLLAGPGQPTEALAHFSQVGADAAVAEVEAAAGWASEVEAMLARASGVEAVRSSTGRRHRVAAECGVGQSSSMKMGRP
jgi:TPR repeat protein